MELLGVCNAINFLFYLFTGSIHSLHCSYNTCLVFGLSIPCLRIWLVADQRINILRSIYEFLHSGIQEETCVGKKN